MSKIFISLFNDQQTNRENIPKVRRFLYNNFIPRSSVNMSTESRLKALQDLALPDDAADIEGPTLPVSFDAGYDFNYKDAAGYETKWAEEGTVLADIEEVIKRGEMFISMIYTYRSVSNPAVQVCNTHTHTQTHMYIFQHFSPLDCPCNGSFQWRLCRPIRISHFFFTI
jgi:hypothetical protein